jgi:hypothetical protein
VLAILATYPLILNFADGIPRGGDSWVNYWNLWWVKTALLDRGVNPFFTPDLHFPFGASLYFHTLNFLPAVIALPVTVMFGIPAAYNFLVLLSFVLSGYGAYRLALYVLVRLEHAAVHDIGRLRLAAFVAGAAFAFSSYRYVHLFGHLDLLSTQWLPLYVLFLLKAMEEGGWKNVVAASLMLSAAMLTAAYYMVFLLVFTGMASVFFLFRMGRRAMPALARTAAILALFALLISPLLAPMLVLGRTEGRAVNPAYDIDRFSTDLLAFVTPSPLQPLWRPIVEPAYRRLVRPGGNSEVIAFLGFAPLILAGIGLAKRQAMRGLWLFLALAFALLALGPILYVAGTAAPLISYAMPYRLFALLPYGDIPRVPARYVVMTTLCLSVIAASGAAFLLSRCRQRFHIAAAALMTILAVGENAATPTAIMMARAPEGFARIAQDNRPVSVIEAPIARDPAQYSIRMMYQTVHRKPIYGGYLARGIPPLSLHALPGFGQFETLSDTVDDVAVYDPTQFREISRAVLNFYSAGYVVIEKALLDAGGVERARRIADALFGSAARIHDADVIVYAAPDAPLDAPPVVWIETGWFNLERLPEIGPDGRPLRWRWMGDRARLGLLSTGSEEVRLKFTAQAFGKPRRVELRLDGAVLATISVTADRKEFETTAFRLNPDGRFLELVSLDGADSPGADPRRLSIALFRLELISSGP